MTQLHKLPPKNNAVKPGGKLAKPVKLPQWVNMLLVLFLFAFTAILYINLGRDALFDWDEGIYAELGRQVLVSGKLFVTSWNGMPWFEKPPGIAWISALGQLVGGNTPFGARLFQPLFAAGVLISVYLIGRRLSSWRVGVIAAALLAGFNLFLGRTRAVNTDMPLLLGITSVVALLMYHKKPIWVASAVALSVWFKGLAGLLPVLISLPLFLTQSRKYWVETALYCAILILPWHLFAFFGYGDTYLTPYLREQVIVRATVPIEFHLESRWFYFNYLYENLGLGMLLAASLGAAFTIKDKKYHLIWWALLPLAVFTVAKTRLFWYILPVYPAVALIVAFALSSLAANKKFRHVLTVIAVLVCLQSLQAAWRSVEPGKTTAAIPDRLQVASALSGGIRELAILVPPSERMAEAILPRTQRISSSFRYGGMPSVVYYFKGSVRFFYNVDEFLTYWNLEVNPTAMVHRADLKLIPSGYQPVTETGDYFGIKKGLYAER